MKKILGLTIAAILVIGMVGVGTWAYFSDTETSTNNTLTAGQLDLKIDGGDVAVTTFAEANIKPGDFGDNVTQLNNAGDIPGLLFAKVSNVTNTDGNIAEVGIGEGELGGAVEIALYIDANGNGTLDDGDVGLQSDNSTYAVSGVTDLVYDYIDNYLLGTWGGTDTGILTLSNSLPVNFGVEWRFPYDPNANQNQCQGDVVSMDFAFELRQMPPPP